MLTTFNEIDMSELMALRATYKDDFEKKHGLQLGFISSFVRASTDALLEYPDVNASELLPGRKALCSLYRRVACSRYRWN
eukprot:SAG11_NODE_1725_length_4370_cov_13.867947_2_plen_80_part_00